MYVLPSRSLKQQKTSPSYSGKICGIPMGWVVAAAAALDALGISVTQHDEPYNEISQGSGTTRMKLYTREG